MMQADMTRAGRELDVRTTRAQRCQGNLASAVSPGHPSLKPIPRPTQTRTSAWSALRKKRTLYSKRANLE
jgi:hypothetical protein